MLGTMPATMPATNHSPETLHCLLTRHIIETGHAPGLQKLADLAGLTEEKTAEVLRKLEEMHGVILAPNSLRIWSLHPFALNPTSLWVSTATGGWWANCAWCSLGIWAAIKQDVNIFTSGGGEESSLDFSIESGQTRRKDLLMHFPYPPHTWWDNPFAPCANILFFSSEAQLDSWCLRHAHPRGSVLPIDVAVRLADLWFGDYASPDWVRKTPARAAEIFNELGLDKSFWKMSGSFR
jgi:Alkylmercury lyase